MFLQLKYLLPYLTKTLLSLVAMKITVLFFGITTDLTGHTSIKVTLSKETKVSDFKTHLLKLQPNLTQLESYAIAINEVYASDDDYIKENDTVAIIPPVSGG